MKRLFAILLVGALLCAALPTATAQQRGDWQIKGSAGVLSLPDIVSIMIVGFGSIDTNENVERGEFVPITNLSADANYWFGEKFAVGGSLTVGHASAWSHFADTGDLSRSINATYPTLAVNATTRYFRKEEFMMYGLWGVGVMGIMARQYDSDNGLRNLQFAAAPMGNIYPLCLQYGERNALFVEVGWGARGVVNIGGSFTF